MQAVSSSEDDEVSKKQNHKGMQKKKIRKCIDSGKVSFTGNKLNQIAVVFHSLISVLFWLNRF